ncbi:MAG: endonuclease [Caudoviricetes sp.]|nr:MAG: endonuclease [Caudoviricetes sp.]
MKVNRNKYIGGVDIAQIMGVSPFGDSSSVFNSKVLGSEVGVTEKMEWGTLIEPLVINKIGAECLTPELAKKYGASDFFYNDSNQLTVLDKEYSFLAGTIDAVKGDVLVEVKTCSNENLFANGVPLHYQYQVQWYLMLLPFLKKATLAVLFNGSSLQEYTILRDDELIEQLKQAAIDFHQNHLLTEKPPLIDKKKKPDDNISENDYEAIRREYIAYQELSKEAEEHKNKAYAIAQSLCLVEGHFNGKKLFDNKVKLSSRLDTASLKRSVDLSPFMKESETLYRRIYL